MGNPSLEYNIVNNVRASPLLQPTLRFTDAEIIAELNRSPIGKAVLDATNNDTIVLEFNPYHPQSNVRGFRIPSSNRGMIFVENHAEFSAPGVIDRSATLREIGNTAVHEGLHALGLGGSWKAEAAVRRLTFEHDFGRLPNAVEIAQMETDMNAAGQAYTGLPGNLGKSMKIVGRAISF